MPSFTEHIHQVTRNLQFLERINCNVEDSLDWQVTVCFYSALHLVNAHLSKFNLSYRKHVDVDYAINPYNISPVKIPESEYIAYVALQSLSRRSRYLINEKNFTAPQAQLIYDPHQRKAIRHLDTLLSFFNGMYSLSLPTISLNCNEISSKNDLKMITILSS